MRLKVVVLLALITVVPSLSWGATLGVKLIQPASGYEYAMSLSDSIGAIKLKADYGYNEVEGSVIKDRGALKIYYDQPIRGAWKIWFFNIAQYNNVYKTRENYLGVGPKYYIFKGDNELSFSTGVLYDYDHVSGEGRGRYSHRPKYAYKDLVEAVYYYQPRTSKPSDYIVKYEVSSVLPGTKKAGKIYCLKEYRSLVGTIEKECGVVINFK